MRRIWCVETHTAGEPTRIVVDCLPYVRGATVVERRALLKEDFDDLRRMLMWEPRGHRDMFGAIVFPPSSPDSDLGVVFMDSSGYIDMCIHGTIGVTTAAIETGLIDMQSPETEVALETPSGIVKAVARIEGSKVSEVTVRNVPSFLYEEGNIDLPSLGAVHVDIAFGGNFFAIVEAKELGLRVQPESYNSLLDLGMRIRGLANQKFKVQHPTQRHIRSIDLVEICDKPSDETAHNRNATIFGAGQIDRSPCGTGTCAKMAALYANGRLKLGQEFVNESILGTLFKGRLRSTTTVGNHQAVNPEVTGRAYIISFSQFVADPSDPLKHGFLL